MEGYEYKELANMLREQQARIIIECEGKQFDIEAIFSVGTATNDPGIVIRLREPAPPYHGMATTAQAGAVQRNEGN